MITIFLGVDGVLNHHTSSGWKNQEGNLVIDDNCLTNYNKFLKHLKQNKIPHQIVLASTWRCFPDAKEKLKEVGVEWNSEVPIQWEKVSNTRNDNILRFVITRDVDPRFMLILDDDLSLREGKWDETWVRTHFNDGGFNDDKLTDALNKIDAIHAKYKAR